MLVERATTGADLAGVLLTPIDASNDLLRNVAASYFGQWQACRVVTNEKGSGESLIDDVWEAQNRGQSIENTAFVALLGVLIEAKIRFVVWHGADYLNLPTVGSWRDAVEVVRDQTRHQPADLYLRFDPSG